MLRIFSLLLTILTIISFSVLFIGSCDTKKDVYPPSESTPEITYKSNKTIIIDAGHGGEDGGTIGKNGVFEKDLNLAISKVLAKKLEENGYKVILTRSDDTLLYDKNSDYKGKKKQQDLSNRLKIANSYGDAVFISIHMNSFPQSQYRGLQVYYSPNSPDSKLLAEEIQNSAHLFLDNTNNRSVKSSNGNIFILDRIEKPAVLIECGFLSNPEESLLLSDPVYQEKLCEVILTSVSSFIDEMDKSQN